MALVFDIWGDLAMFRKPYTTTSMVSFPFPPPSAIGGLLGAIAGIDHGAAHGALRADYWPALTGIQVALGLKRPVAWYSSAVNLIKFKSPNGDMSEHIQVKHQLLKRPAYRIYVRGDGPLYDSLRQRLQRGEFVFTPCLGVAYALADLAFAGEYDEQPVPEQSPFIDTVLPCYGDARPNIEMSGCLHSEIVPFRLDTWRRQQETVSVIYSDRSHRSNDQICLQQRGDVEVTQLGGEKVAWFARW